MTLKVVECAISEPIRYHIIPGTKFRPGFLAQFYNIDGDILCGISDGSKPCGIAGDYYSDNIINIFVQRMIFRTDEFGIIEANKRSLYASKNGFLTTIPIDSTSYCIAKLIEAPTSNRNWIEALFL